MRLYVIRHGETTWNKEKRLQGRTDISLSQEGRRLAELTGKALLDVPFDLVITSPLQRARETAELALCGRNVPFLMDERIIEISFGEYEGLRSDKSHYEIPDKHFPDFFEHPDRYHAPPDGESIVQVCRRTKAFMEELLQDPGKAGMTILISSHGCASRGILNAVRKYEMKDYWFGGVPKNCSVSILECQQNQVRLLEKDRVYYKEQRQDESRQ